MARPPVIQGIFSFSGSVALVHGIKRLLHNHLPKEWLADKQDGKKNVLENTFEKVNNVVQNHIEEIIPVPDPEVAFAGLRWKEMPQFLKEEALNLDLRISAAIIIFLVLLPIISAIFAASISTKDENGLVELSVDEHILQVTTEETNNSNGNTIYQVTESTLVTVLIDNNGDELKKELIESSTIEMKQNKDDSIPEVENFKIPVELTHTNNVEDINQEVVNCEVDDKDDVSEQAKLQDNLNIAPVEPAIVTVPTEDSDDPLEITIITVKDEGYEVDDVEHDIAHEVKCEDEDCDEDDRGEEEATREEDPEDSDDKTDSEENLEEQTKDAPEYSKEEPTPDKASSYDQKETDSGTTESSTSTRLSFKFEDTEIRASKETHKHLQILPSPAKRISMEAQVNTEQAYSQPFLY